MEYQQRLVKARTPADDWYRMQLRALQERYRQAANLTASLVAEAELAAPGSSVVTQGNVSVPADLRSLYQTYKAQSQRLSEPVDRWFVQQLGSLKNTLVREGRLAEALAIDQALKAVGSSPAIGGEDRSDSWLSLRRWRVPSGGHLSLQEGALVLRGPGDLPFRMTVALCEIPLTENVRIEGEIEIRGGGGLVVAAASNLGEFVFLSSSDEGTRIFEVIGRNVRVVATVSGRRHLNEWVPFELQRVKESIRIQLGSDRANIPIGGRYGASWGLITSESNLIRCRMVRAKNK